MEHHIHDSNCHHYEIPAYGTNEAKPKDKNLQESIILVFQVNEVMALSRYLAAEEDGIKEGVEWEIEDQIKGRRHENMVYGFYLFCFITYPIYLMSDFS